MSGSIGPTSLSYSLLNTLIGNSATVHHQLDTLTEQASSGLVAQTYAGLGAGAGIALNLNPQLATLQTYQANISQATGRMQMTQTAMTQIQQIAATFVADMPKLNKITPTEIDSVAANARTALSQLANLLNTKQGNTYVFSGQDTANPPVPSPDQILQSPFFTQINTAVSTLSTNGAAATTAQTLAIAGPSGTSPFSTYMSQSPPAIKAPVVQTGQGATMRRRVQRFHHGVLYARPDARPGHSRFHVELAGDRSQLHRARAGHHDQPQRHRQQHGNRCRRSGRQPGHADRHSNQPGRHRHRLERPSLRRAGGRHGHNTFKPHRDTDAAASILSSNKRRKQSIAGQFSSGVGVNFFCCSYTVNFLTSLFAMSSQKARI
jgi:hypothetical protein